MTTHLTTSRGNLAANQYIVYNNDCTLFQSYNSTIVKTCFEDGERRVYLDSYYWNYSRTTAKYRNQFLGESTKEIESKIKDGTYLLTNLNN